MHNNFETIDPNLKISLDTTRNCSRLNVASHKNKSKSRANKTLSERLFVPSEYLTHRNNKTLVENVVTYIHQQQLSVENALYSLGLNLLSGCSLSSSAQQKMEAFICENARPVDEFLAVEFPFPHNERDFLGVVYQSLMTEGEKNARGSYFTPSTVVDHMCEDFTIGEHTKILDPCCGSGAFLLHIPGTCPENLEGMDIDPIAVMLAKFNFFARFPQTHIDPPIRQADFFAESVTLSSESYDLIISNPPWGDKKKKRLSKMSFITSRESFSYFLVAAHALIKPGGEVRFLLPEAVLNVRQHADVRRYIVEQKGLRVVRFHGKLFSGVTTSCISLTLGRKEEAATQITVKGRGTTYTVPCDELNYGVHCVFPLLHPEDHAIVSAAERLRQQDLGRSIWALGIVTGDNSSKLHAEQRFGAEPIYTGKEVNRYRLSPPRNYIFFRKEEMQQVADEALYRTSPKLVYRFIGKKLTFALDSSGSLILNSANLLVPHVEHLSTNSLLALLNSELYQFLYIKLFGEIKILQGNLVQLPLPFLSEADDQYLSSCVEHIEKPGMDEEIQSFIFRLYGLTSDLVAHIKQELY